MTSLIRSSSTIRRTQASGRSGSSLKEAWVRLMVLDERIKDVIDELRQRHLDQFVRQDSLKKHAQIFAELLAQTPSNRLLVGEKVIQRANRSMRTPGNHVRRRRIKAALIEPLGSRL